MEARRRDVLAVRCTRLRRLDDRPLRIARVLDDEAVALIAPVHIAEIMNILRQRKFENELEDWLAEIRDTSYIDIKEF